MKLIAILVSLLLVFGITFWSLYGEVVRYITYAEKYTEQNIPKNWGWRKQALKLVSASTEIVPKPNHYPKEEITALFDSWPKLQTSNTNKHVIEVSNLAELQTAVSNPQKAIEVLLLPGVYRLDKKIRLNSSFPLTIRGKNPNSVVIEINRNVGVEVISALVTISDLIFKGICTSHQYCDHAIHVFGDADYLMISNSDFVNFNAAIKANGFTDKNSGKQEFPDFAQITNNRIYNETTRNSSVPVTPIDVVGGDNWLVSTNFIADFAKKRGNRISYGVFLKGGGQSGIIKNNLIACEWNVPHFSSLDSRVGLSLGGGGTGAKYCKSSNCNYEHMNGTIKDNLVVNCANEVSVYINKSHGSLISGNILFNTVGIDINHGSKGTVITNNVLHGSIRNRESEIVLESNNTVLGPFEHVKSIH